MLHTYLRALRETFRSQRDKYSAHDRARPILADIAADRSFMTEALEAHLRKPGALRALNYPVVAVDIELNADFGLLLNCWIPLPDGDTDMSTKAIHHHGHMLLSTTTLLGPGYEHWVFSRPRSLDSTGSLVAMRVEQRGAHSVGNTAFVPDETPHLPMYPAALSVTMALWSNRLPTTWRDHLKRVPAFSRNTDRLRRLGVRMGLARTLDLKVVRDFDFFPCDDGFRVMRDRQEFGLGPNSDHLCSLFHVLQGTGNESLGPVMEDRLRSGEELPNRSLVESLLRDLRAGRPIAGRLSSGHTNLPYANFRRAQIERALAAGPPAAGHASG